MILNPFPYSTCFIILIMNFYEITLFANKGKFGGSWVEDFYNDLARHASSRAWESIGSELIMHEPGKERERAEEVARKNADELGRDGNRCGRC